MSSNVWPSTPAADEILSALPDALTPRLDCRGSGEKIGPLILGACPALQGYAYGDLVFVLSGVTPALPRVNVKRVAIEDNPGFVAE